MIARAEAAGIRGANGEERERSLGDAHHCSDSLPAGGEWERASGRVTSVEFVSSLRLPGDSGGRGTETSTGDRRVGPAAVCPDASWVGEDPDPARYDTLCHLAAMRSPHGFTNPR
jgi:hypothetical protein